MSGPRVWLTAIRLAKDMTQKEVADAAGIDRSFYTQIEAESVTQALQPQER